MIQFVLDDLEIEDATRPFASRATGLFMRMLAAWQRQGAARDLRATELELAAALGLSPEALDTAKALSQAPRARGRPRGDPMDRIPGLEEFIALDAERVRAVFRKHWGKRNYMDPLIPTVAEIIQRRWAEDAANHGVKLDELSIARLTKRNKSKQRRLEPSP